MDESYIQTYTGKHYYFKNPTVDMIDIGDIAHALSQINRYTGHTKFPYNVAQHSLIVASLVPFPMQLEALMHDAHEAYVNDIARPLKLLLPDYQMYEDKAAHVVKDRFGLFEGCDGTQFFNYKSTIKRADIIALITEQRDFMPADDTDWRLGFDVQPMAEHIEPLSPSDSEFKFMRMFEALWWDRNDDS